MYFLLLFFPVEGKRTAILRILESYKWRISYLCTTHNDIVSLDITWLFNHNNNTYKIKRNVSENRKEMVRVRNSEGERESAHKYIFIRITLGRVDFLRNWGVRGDWAKCFHNHNITGSSIRTVRRWVIWKAPWKTLNIHIDIMHIMEQGYSLPLF